MIMPACGWFPAGVLVTNHVPESERGSLAAEERHAEPLECSHTYAVGKNLGVAGFRASENDSSTCVCFGSQPVKLGMSICRLFDIR